MEPEKKTTAVKAHIGAVVTAVATLAAGYLTGGLEAEMVQTAGATIATAIAAWLGIYFAPANKEKE